MATPVATITGATAIPGVGWIIGLAAAVIDAKYVMPALAGKGKQAALPPRLQDMPVGSNEAGAPRIWAIGGRVRVPTHVLWQKEKVRETTAQRNKAGTDVPQREVLIDCLISLNDRRTVEMTQLIGNGKLLVWDSRNLVRLTTHEMTAAVSGANVVVTMGNTLVPSPTDAFKVGDFVRLYGWVSTAGPSINSVYWRISAITGHTSTSGTITLQVVDGQSVASVAANGGNAFSPAHIERVDDALICDPAAFTLSSGPGEVRYGGYNRNVSEVFNPGDHITLVYMQGIPPGGEWFVIGHQGTTIRFGVVPPTTGGFALPVGGNTWPRIEFFGVQTSTTTMFPPNFVPKDNFHDGSEDQGEDPILVAEKGTGNVPAYRGLCYQAIDEMRVTDFGGQLPYSLEAIIRPDESMTWAQAISEVLQRAGVPKTAIDTSGITLRPFLGYFIRGSVPTATSIQPLLLAGHIIGQERDGTLALFHVDNADVTQIENGAAFSDLGAHIHGEPRADSKIATEDGAEEDLPTFVGVRHQDPDNAYTDGYQPFGLRNPNGVAHENRQEIDVSTLVLSRKDAKNLATTTVRRSWINNRKYRWALTACYLDQLENDIQTVTDDDGNDLIGRVAQRDIGANFIVNCTLVREDLDLAVRGSPVQSAAATPPPAIITPAILTAVVMDIPSLRDVENEYPALRFAVCANQASHWAGGRIYESTDGANYSPANSLGEQSVIGTLEEPTPAVAGSSETYGSTLVTFFDAPVDVTFENEEPFGIASCTPADALAGRNWCVFVDQVTGEVELAAFTDATPIAPRRYTLNGWLRGLRGTRAAVHPTDCKLVMVGPASEYPTVLRQYPGLSQPTALAFKFVPAGKTIDEVDAVQIVSTWRNTRPLPVRRIVKTIGATPFDARFTVEHWTRQHLPLGALPPYVMDEPYEGYKLTIWNPTGTIIKRTKTIQASPGMGTQTLRDRWFDYPASEQTTDGYTPGAATTFTIDVQQFGAFGSTFGLSDSVKQVI